MTVSRMSDTAAHAEQVVNMPEDQRSGKKNQCLEVLTILGEGLLFNLQTIPAAVMATELFQLWPLPYHRMAEFGLAPLFVQAKYISDFLINTKQPLQQLRDAGVKRIIGHVGAFATGMIVCVGAGAGIGVGELALSNTIDGTPWLSAITSTTAYHGPIMLGLSSALYAVNKMLYTLCLDDIKTDEAQPSRNFIQNVCHYAVARPLNAACLMWLLCQITAAAGADELVFNPHFSLITIALDQVLTGLEYVCYTQNPIQHLVPHAKWQPRQHDERTGLIGGANELAPTARDQNKALGWYGLRTLAVVAAGVATMELINMSIKPLDNAADINYDSQLEVVSWLGAIAVGEVVERLMENYSTIKQTVSGCWTSLWQRCHRQQDADVAAAPVPDINHNESLEQQPLLSNRA